MKKLFNAIKKRYFDLVKKILDDKSDLIDGLAKQPPKVDDEKSLFQVAIKDGTTDIANYLLDKGANVNFIEAETSTKDVDAMASDKSLHSKIIKSLCKEILIPIGVFQKGNSRVYFDDNGFYLTMVEFQPSSWSRGSYLNVGVYFLWNGYDYFSCDVFKGLSARVENFSEYRNNEQFEKEVRNKVMVAKEQILYFRNPDNVKEVLYKKGISKHIALYLAYHGQIEAARAEYALFMKNPYFAKISKDENLPKTLDELTQDFVIERIKSKRKSLHDKYSTRKLPWNKILDGEKPKK